MPKGQYERPSLESRITSRIIKDDITGCWIYQGIVDKDNYGQISDKCRTRHTHRCMYEITNGEIPKGLIVGHLCDDKYPKDSKLYRQCCNPAHLQLMTNKQNLERMVTLGRSVVTTGAFQSATSSGENNIKSKLTGEKVKEIRRKATTAKYGELHLLAAEYDIQYQTLYKIVKGKLWNAPEYFPS
jgi:hypothetical protein